MPSLSKAEIERSKMVREIVREQHAQQQEEERRQKARERKEEKRRQQRSSGQKEPALLKIDTAIRNAIWGKGNW